MSVTALDCLALIDVHVIDIEASSHLSRSMEAIITSEGSKKEVEICGGCKGTSSFIHSMQSVNGVLGKAAESLLRRLAENILIDGANDILNRFYGADIAANNLC